ncbi:MAG: cache domain-containing protein, partial [Noviherbaspirillum sp.]
MRLPALPRLPLPLQLGIFLACALSLVWGLIAFDLHRTHRQTMDHAELRIQNLVRAFAEGVKSAVNSIDHTLIDLRDKWQAGTPDFRDTVRRRQSFLEQDVGFQVAIIDISGKLLFSSADRNAEKVDLSDREHFRVHKEQTGDWLFISKPVFGRISGRWSLQFTRPLLDDAGNFTGVIVLSVSPEFFSRFYQTIDLGKDSLIMLVRGSGQILARSPRPEIGIGKSLSRTPFMQNREEEAGLYHQPSEVDGVDRLYGWRRLPKGDLVVALGLSMETIVEPYHQQRRSYIMAGAVLSLVLAAIGYLMLQGLRQRAQTRRALEETRKALQHSQKMEALGRLTGGIAHDFNNVLQTLTTGIQLALFSAPDAKAKSTLEACQRAVERGMELTRQLLVFGRVQDANLKTVGLAERINGMSPLLRGALPSNIGFHLELAEGLWPARIDPLQFELALLNLTMNARDAMPEGGHFTIAARNLTRRERLGDLEPGNYLEVTVSDTGEGMDKEVMAKALDPFFTTKAVGKGSGMGLSQVYGFVRQMGGALTL